MAIEGSTIISQHILDDTGLRETLTANEQVIRTSANRMAMVLRDPSGRFVKGFQDSGFMLRRALAESETAVAGFSGTATSHFGKASSSAAELTHAGWALRSSLHLVTGETGFLATEILMTSAHMSRLITAAGGATAAVTALGAATKGFLVSIGPVGWAILALGAAYLAYERLTKTDEETTKRAAKEHEHLTTIFEAESKARLDLAVAQGQITAADRRRMDLIGAGRMPDSVESGAIANILRDEAALAKIEALRKEPLLVLAPKEDTAGFDAFMDSENKLRAAREQSERSVYELRRTLDKQSFEEAVGRIKRENDLRLHGLTSDAKALEDLAIKAGIIAPSSREGNPLLQRIMRLDEMQAAQRAALELNGGATFGTVTTRESSQFRFGPGAMGSVVGEQSEQKKTNELLKQLIDGQKEQTRQFVGNEGLDLTLYGSEAYLH